MTDELLSDPLLRDVPVIDGMKVLEPCVLLSKLGAGGMGAVYRGRHLNLDIEVAVKCLKPSLASENEQFVARFQREARIAATINHPNLIRVFDVTEKHGLHYLVMEFVQGETARERVRRKGALPLAEALAIVAGAAAGLEAAHERDIIHRDIKPDNILISTDGEVKLADLGLAKVREGSDGMTATNMVLGTPQYMPPEQWEGASKVGAPGDVYALGATLFFLLAGRDAIAGGSMTEMFKRVCVDPFPNVTTLLPHVPENVRQIISLCTQKQDTARYRDAGALMNALRGVMPAAVSRAALRDPETGAGTVRCTLVSPPPEDRVAGVRDALRESALQSKATTPAVQPTEPARRREGRTYEPDTDAPTIPPKIKSTSNSSGKSGILVGAVVLVVAAIGGTWWFMREGDSKKKDDASPKREVAENGEKPKENSGGASSDVTKPKETNGKIDADPQKTEVDPKTVTPKVSEVTGGDKTPKKEDPKPRLEDQKPPLTESDDDEPPATEEDDPPAEPLKPKTTIQKKPEDPKTAAKTPPVVGQWTLDRGATFDLLFTQRLKEMGVSPLDADPQALADARESAEDELELTRADLTIKADGTFSYLDYTPPMDGDPAAETKVSGTWTATKDGGNFTATLVDGERPPSPVKYRGVLKDGWLEIVGEDETIVMKRKN